MLGEDKHNESWEKALKKCATPSNGLKHMVTAHVDNDSIRVLLKKKAREEDPVSPVVRLLSAVLISSGWISPGLIDLQGKVNGAGYIFGPMFYSQQRHTVNVHFWP